MNRSAVPSDDTGTVMPVYDVIYIDAQGSETQLAEALEERSDAAELARRVAAERGAGRMVLPGSDKLPNCVCVIPQPPR